MKRSLQKNIIFVAFVFTLLLSGCDFFEKVRENFLKKSSQTIIDVSEQINKTTSSVKKKVQEVKETTREIKEATKEVNEALQAVKKLGTQEKSGADGGGAMITPPPLSPPPQIPAARQEAPNLKDSK